MSAVTVERYAVVDGERVPLSKCDWLHIAPCGCACGVHVAELNDMVVPSEDDAMIAFTRTETAREAERDRAAGFTVRLITHEQFCADESLLKCDHDPMWGVRKVTPPEGYKWAVRSGMRRQLYQHVAPVAATCPPLDEAGKYPTEGSAALCGAGDKRTWWRTDWHYLDGTMRCTRCERAADA